MYLAHNLTLTQLAKFGFSLLLLLTFAVTAFAQDAAATMQAESGSITANVEITPEAAGPNGVTFEYYPVCCKPCKESLPVRKCSDCCPGSSVTANAITFIKSQAFKITKTGSLLFKLNFKEIAPGRYRVTNNAGLVVDVEVEAKEKTDLGKIVIDTGQEIKRPRSAAGPDRPPVQ